MTRRKTLSSILSRRSMSSLSAVPGCAAPAVPDHLIQFFGVGGELHQWHRFRVLVLSESKASSLTDVSFSSSHGITGRKNLNSEISNQRMARFTRSQRWIRVRIIQNLLDISWGNPPKEEPYYIFLGLLARKMVHPCSIDSPSPKNEIPSGFLLLLLFLYFETLPVVPVESLNRGWHVEVRSWSSLP